MNRGPGVIGTGTRIEIGQDICGAGDKGECGRWRRKSRTEQRRAYAQRVWLRYGRSTRDKQQKRSRGKVRKRYIKREDNCNRCEERESEKEGAHARKRTEKNEQREFEIFV